MSPSWADQGIEPASRPCRTWTWVLNTSLAGLADVPRSQPLKRPVGELRFGLSGHLISFSNTCVTCVLAEGHRRPLSCEDNCKDRSKKREPQTENITGNLYKPQVKAAAAAGIHLAWLASIHRWCAHIWNEKNPGKLQPLFSLSTRRGLSPISMQTKSLPLPVHE